MKTVILSIACLTLAQGAFAASYPNVSEFEDKPCGKLGAKMKACSSRCLRVLTCALPEDSSMQVPAWADLGFDSCDFDSGCN